MQGGCAALRFDILSSLKDFGFARVFGVNAHGDINHAIALMQAFKDAGEKLGIRACFPFDEGRLVHFGLGGSEAHIYPVKPQEVKVSQAAVWDVHGGDIKELSPEGYLGSPRSYETVDVARNVEDYAQRISEAIMRRIERDSGSGDDAGL